LLEEIDIVDWCTLQYEPDTYQFSKTFTGP